MESVWTTRSTRRGTELTLRAGPPRPLVARLTDEELARVQAVLPDITETVRRGEFSRIALAVAFRDAIGRDPFRQQPRPGAFSWWEVIGNSAYLVVGLGAALGDNPWWWRLLGALVTAVGVSALAGQFRAARRARAHR